MYEIPKELCESLIDECNTKIWEKHKWNNYAEGTFESEPTKELDVMSCTKEQQAKIYTILSKSLIKIPRLKHSKDRTKDSGTMA